MEQTIPSILEYGNFAVGIGTLALAIVLGLLGWRTSIRDRAVHIADKRQDWIKEFRANLSELVAMQTILTLTDTSQEIDIVMEKYFMYSDRIELMFYFKHPGVKEFLLALEKVNQGVKEKDSDGFSENRALLMKRGKEIIRYQTVKIAKLDSSEPLV